MTSRYQALALGCASGGEVDVHDPEALRIALGPLGCRRATTRRSRAGLTWAASAARPGSGHRGTSAGRGRSRCRRCTCGRGRRPRSRARTAAAGRSRWRPGPARRRGPRARPPSRWTGVVAGSAMATSGEPGQGDGDAEAPGVAHVVAAVVVDAERAERGRDLLEVAVADVRQVADGEVVEHVGQVGRPSSTACTRGGWRCRRCGGPRRGRPRWAREGRTGYPALLSEMISAPGALRARQHVDRQPVGQQYVVRCSDVFAGLAWADAGAVAQRPPPGLVDGGPPAHCARPGAAHAFYARTCSAAARAVQPPGPPGPEAGPSGRG